MMWELWMFGVLPYTAMSNAEVYEAVKKGYRLPAPTNCPAEVVELMTQCWNSNPKERPDFFVRFFFAHITLEYLQDI